MQYNEAVAYIENIPKFASKNTLESTAYFLASIGNPQEKYKVIHVAGTNGKGSTCAYLNTMIHAMNYKVGMFTSPHLLDMTERICINNKDISKTEFVEVFNLVYRHAKRLEKEGIPHPSFFEFVMIMGLVAFERAKVEYVILETGLGGRLDSTNVVNTPVVNIITSVGVDHEKYLGSTIEAIAYEKAGIIKENTTVIYDDSFPSVNLVIDKVIQSKGNKCRKLSDSAYEIKGKTPKYIAFSMNDGYHIDSLWHIPNKGSYQVKNAILAIMAMEELFGRCDEKVYMRAIKGTYWPGRMEEVASNIYVDGAHNVPAIESLIQESEEIHTVVFSAVDDKDYNKIIELIVKGINPQSVIVTTLDNQRGVQSEVLQDRFVKCGQVNVLSIDCVDNVMKYLEKRDSREKVLCVGSLYLVGEIKSYTDKYKGV